MDGRQRLRQTGLTNSNEWETSFSHILQRTRLNLDKISKPAYQQPADHSYLRSLPNQNNEYNDPGRGSQQRAQPSGGYNVSSVPSSVQDENSYCNDDSINRAHDMPHGTGAGAGVGMGSSGGQGGGFYLTSGSEQQRGAGNHLQLVEHGLDQVARKQVSLEAHVQHEQNELKERMTANEGVSDHLMSRFEAQAGDIKELQRLVASQAVHINRQNAALEGVNQELDSRRNQIAKMDSWIRQEETWRHDIEDQVDVMSKRVKGVERTAKETSDLVGELNTKIDSMELLLRNTTSLTSNWNAQTDAFMKRVEKKLRKNSMTAHGLRDEGGASDDDLSDDAEVIPRERKETAAAAAASASATATPAEGGSRGGSSRSARGGGTADVIGQAGELFSSPSAVMFKKNLLSEMDIMVRASEAKVGAQVKTDFKAEMSDSVRHMRIEIQNYLYRLSADVGLLSPVLLASGGAGGGDGQGSIFEAGVSGSGESASPSKLRPQQPQQQQSQPHQQGAGPTGSTSYFVPSSSHGKVALNQQVDSMHYRLEDVCNAIAVIKEDTESSYSSLQHNVQSIDSRIDEVAITSNANLTSLQNRAAHLEEVVHAMELKMHKSLTDSKEEVMNKLRESVMGSNDERSSMERRVAIVENIISTLAEKNKVSNDTIDLYFSSSKDIKKFDLNCVKVDGLQVELKHVREELRGVSASMSRFTAQTPRMDDILELRERVAHVEPLTTQVASLQSSYAEGKETTNLLRQLVKSLEDKSLKVDDTIAGVQQSISSNINPSIAKQANDIAVLSADLGRCNTALSQTNDTMKSQAITTAEKWDRFKGQIHERIRESDEASKTAQQGLNNQLFESGKKHEALAEVVVKNNNTLQKTVVDSNVQLDSKWQTQLMKNKTDMQAEYNSAIASANAAIEVVKGDLVALVQSELQHTKEMNAEYEELEGRLCKVEDAESALALSVNMNHEYQVASTKQQCSELHDQITVLEEQLLRLEELSHIVHTQQSTLTTMERERKVAAATQRAQVEELEEMMKHQQSVLRKQQASLSKPTKSRRMSSFSQMEVIEKEEEVSAALAASKNTAASGRVIGDLVPVKSAARSKSPGKKSNAPAPQSSSKKHPKVEITVPERSEERTLSGTILPFSNSAGNSPVADAALLSPGGSRKSPSSSLHMIFNVNNSGTESGADTSSAEQAVLPTKQQKSPVVATPSKLAKEAAEASAAAIACAAKFGGGSRRSSVGRRGTAYYDPDSSGDAEGEEEEEDVPEQLQTPPAAFASASATATLPTAAFDSQRASASTSATTSKKASVSASKSTGKSAAVPADAASSGIDPRLLSMNSRRGSMNRRGTAYYDPDSSDGEGEEGSEGESEGEAADDGEQSEGSANAVESFEEAEAVEEEDSQEDAQGESEEQEDDGVQEFEEESEEEEEDGTVEGVEPEKQAEHEISAACTPGQNVINSSSDDDGDSAMHSSVKSTPFMDQSETNIVRTSETSFYSFESAGNTPSAAAPAAASATNATTGEDTSAAASPWSNSASAKRKPSFAEIVAAKESPAAPTTEQKQHTQSVAQSPANPQTPAQKGKRGKKDKSGQKSPDSAQQPPNPWSAQSNGGSDSAEQSPTPGSALKGQGSPWSNSGSARRKPSFAEIVAAGNSATKAEQSSVISASGVNTSTASSEDYSATTAYEHTPLQQRNKGQQRSAPASASSTSSSSRGGRSGVALMDETSFLSIPCMDDANDDGDSSVTPVTTQAALPAAAKRFAAAVEAKKSPNKTASSSQATTPQMTSASASKLQVHGASGISSPGSEEFFSPSPQMNQKSFRFDDATSPLGSTSNKSGSKSTSKSPKSSSAASSMFKSVSPDETDEFHDPEDGDNVELYMSAARDDSEDERDDAGANAVESFTHDKNSSIGFIAGSDTVESFYDADEMDEPEDRAAVVNRKINEAARKAAALPRPPGSTTGDIVTANMLGELSHVLKKRNSLSTDNSPDEEAAPPRPVVTPSATGGASSSGSAADISNIVYSTGGGDASTLNSSTAGGEDTDSKKSAIKDRLKNRVKKK